MKVDHLVVLYMKEDQRPDRAALQSLASMLDGPVEDMVRKDGAFKALGLTAADYVGNAEAVVDVLDTHIELLQRPILVRAGKAIIGRPKERIAEFLG
ncbi:MAG: arsenate reductase [Myxococcales bacterium]|nr:arsenate reductase [Myxococcales bacterium]